MAKKSSEGGIGCFGLIFVFGFLAWIGDVIKEHPIISSVIGIVILGCIIFFFYSYFKTSSYEECEDPLVSIKEYDEDLYNELKESHEETNRNVTFSYAHKKTYNVINKINEEISDDAFVNFHAQVIQKYKIKGKNSQTNRRKTIYVNATNEEQAFEISQSQGILPPYETEVELNYPSQNQINYALKLGIKIPESATSFDIYCLLTRYEDGDPTNGNLELLEFAGNRGLLYSKFIGKKSLYNLIFDELNDLDRIAFFIFCIYRYLSDDRDGNLDTHINKQSFYDFANEHLYDQKFLKSMNEYSGQSLRFFGSLIVNNRALKGGSIDTYAYKEAAKYLNEHFGTPLTRVKRIE